MSLFYTFMVERLNLPKPNRLLMKLSFPRWYITGSALVFREEKGFHTFQIHSLSGKARVHATL